MCLYIKAVKPGNTDVPLMHSTVEPITIVTNWLPWHKLAVTWRPNIIVALVQLRTHLGFTLMHTTAVLGLHYARTLESHVTTTTCKSFSSDTSE